MKGLLHVVSFLSGILPQLIIWRWTHKVGRPEL